MTLWYYPEYMADLGRKVYNCLMCCVRRKVYHQSKRVDVVEGVYEKKHYWDRKVMERELVVLNYLNQVQGFPIPRVIGANWPDKVLTLSYCGISLRTCIARKEVLPSDYEFQINQIAHRMDLFKVYHNDLSLSNFTVMNNQIYLIDFGHATLDEPKQFIGFFKPAPNDYQRIIDRLHKHYERHPSQYHYVI